MRRIPVRYSDWCYSRPTSFRSASRSLCSTSRRNTPFSRIITAIRKWTCANYFKRTTKIDRFRTDIFGPYNLWRLSPPISRRKSRNFHNVWSYKYNSQSLRWLHAATFTITDLRAVRRGAAVLPVSAKPSFAVILRRYRQSPYSRLYKFSVTSRATYGYSPGQRNGSPQFSPGSTHSGWKSLSAQPLENSEDTRIYDILCKYGFELNCHCSYSRVCLIMKPIISTHYNLSWNNCKILEILWNWCF